MARAKALFSTFEFRLNNLANAVRYAGRSGSPRRPANGEDIKSLKNIFFLRALHGAWWSYLFSFGCGFAAWVLRGEFSFCAL
jgi:hypothetical protein